MNPLGLYEPGTSVVHRLGAGTKLLGLLAWAVLCFLLHTPLLLGIAALLAIGGYMLARVPWRRCWQLGRVLVPVLIVLFGVQWWLLDFDRALSVTLRLFATLAVANLFTLTTRVNTLVDAVERGLRPTRRLGLRPERISLLVGLTVQAVAALSTIAAQTREAQRARNAERSLPAFAVPFLVRTLRHADSLGEALAARGVDDD